MSQNTNRPSQIDSIMQVPTCPVCHQFDQVQTMQTAFTKGNVALQTPPSTRQSTRVWPWFIVGALVVVCAAIQFFLFIQTGGPAGFQGWPLALQVGEVAVAAVVLVVVVGLSLLAFRRLVRGNEETVWQYPANDQRSQKLRQAYHCNRDNVVFDAEQHKVLSAEEIHSLLEGTTAY